MGNTTKKILGILMLFGAFCTTSAFAQNNFTMNPIRITVGEDAKLTVGMDNETTFYGFQADITLPYGLEVVMEGKSPSVSLSERFDASYSLTSNLIKDNLVRLGAFSYEHKTIEGNSGGIFELKVRATDDFEGGDVKVSNILCITEDDKDVRISDVSAYIDCIVPVKYIILSQESVQLHIGETIQLEASVLPENTTDKNVYWTSSDVSVAIVDAEGNVTAHSLGETVITATCGDVNAECTISVVPTPAESIRLNFQSAELKVGESIKLTATVLPEDATDKSITWTSSDVSVAIVDAEGKVTAVSLGETVITARCGEVTAECRISVVVTPVESIALNIESAQLKVGESVNLTATVLPEDATDKTIEWCSEDESIAIVNADGNVTAVGLGETVIIALSGNVSAECRISVVATPVESIALNIESAQLKVGESVKLEALVHPDEATVKTVEWSSADESIAKVDSDGNVTAVGLGETVITARCGEVTAECRISVVATPVESIALNIESAQLKIGESISLEATVLPADATDKSITWTSSDVSVATVDAEGNVTAHSLGETVITATCGDVTAECLINVDPIIIEALEITPLNHDGEIGSRFHIDYLIMPEDATNKDVSFVSTDTNIAIVDEDGNVEIVGEGNCRIIVSTLDGSGITAECVICGLSDVSVIFNTTDSKISLYNMNGVIIKEDCTKEDLRFIKPGIYIIRIGQMTKTMILR